MSRHGPHTRPSSNSPAPVSRRLHTSFEQQRQLLRQRMSQHKYNPRQMLFVKNVPQESAMRIASLFTEYKPLETKNLYPDSRITTFMIALPSIGATDDALRDTDGLRVGNTVITVERYNPKQSIVARRDARRKRKDIAADHAEHCYEEEDYNYDEYDEDEDTRAEQDTCKAAKLVAKQPEPEAAFAPPRTRRVSESSGISWANVAGGMQLVQSSPQPEHRSDSPVFPVRFEALQQKPDETELFPDFDPNFQEEDLLKLSLSVNASPKESFSLPNISAPAVTLPLWQPPPQILLMPPSGLRRPHPVSPQSQPIEALIHDLFSTAPGLRSSPATLPQDTKTSRVDEDSSQQDQLPVIVRSESEGMNMPVDTSSYLRTRHCATCTFCKMRKLRTG